MMRPITRLAAAVTPLAVPVGARPTRAPVVVAGVRTDARGELHMVSVEPGHPGVGRMERTP